MRQRHDRNEKEQNTQPGARPCADFVEPADSFYDSGLIGENNFKNSVAGDDNHADYAEYTNDEEQPLLAPVKPHFID